MQAMPARALPVCKMQRRETIGVDAVVDDSVARRVGLHMLLTGSDVLAEAHSDHNDVGHTTEDPDCFRL